MFWRIRCHFCTSRQPHNKSVTEFQCTVCEAINYLDGKGNIVDTPYTATSSLPSRVGQEKQFQTDTRPLPQALQHQQEQTFCPTCTKNQHVYNNILAEYLPDESDPTYHEKVRALPRYKKDLESRYPLICKKCAPLAQTKINRADYYGMAHYANKQVADTRARGGRAAYRTRDDVHKKFMRNLLRLIEFTLFLGLLVHVGFHAYGIATTLFGPASSEPEFTDETDVFFTLSPQECVQGALSLKFHSACFRLFSTLVPQTLTLAAIFIWFNPALKEWYHHTRRVEAINGQKNYFYMQLIILAIRSMAWYTLSDPTYTTKLDKEQTIAMHGFAILFMLMTQAVANRSLQPQLWMIKGKIMPKPSEIDLLSASAGPAIEHYTPKASSKHPLAALRPDNPPLDINSLAPKPQRPIFPPPTYFNQAPPSPEFSDVDPMETDDRPIMRSSLYSTKHPRLEPRHTYMNHTNAPALGFSDVRNQIYGMEEQMRAEEERRQQEQQEKLHYQPQRPSPFYGKLPPEPMSMERRLRNPVLRPLEPEKIPLSQQKDFMAQMRRGVKPVQFPEKGSNFQPKQSQWVLPGDVKDLGLEDRFAASFSLQDGSPVNQRKGFLGLW